MRQTLECGSGVPRPKWAMHGTRTNKQSWSGSDGKGSMTSDLGHSLVLKVALFACLSENGLGA